MKIVHRESADDQVVGVALTAALGFATGLFAGMVVGELLGDVDSGRVRGALRKLRRSSETTLDPDTLEDAVRDALAGDEKTRDLGVAVHSPGDGLVELTGVAPDAVSRQAAGDLARRVSGASVVVNRILVEGTDLPPQPISQVSP